ncbi:34420_t:CDS:2 [Gigaspora margarita]|uniref:34420_t:CDS:1 n=1 Tax=Gigaspora margarita TaxID=4874 RepID=A0ABN7VY05_GIGMA|nr:34420_t:CDS:2 [Gigaspora margarita]
MIEELLIKPKDTTHKLPVMNIQRKLNEALIQQLTFEIGYEVTWNHQNGPVVDMGESIDGLEFEESKEEEWNGSIDIDPEEWPQPIDDFIDWKEYDN